MTDFKVRFMTAIAIVASHIFAPLFILFGGVINDSMSIRAEVALVFAPVTGVYVSTIMLFAVNNMYVIDPGRKVNMLFTTLITMVVVGFLLLYWGVLMSYKNGAFGTNGDNAINTLKG